MLQMLHHFTGTHQPFDACEENEMPTSLATLGFNEVVSVSNANCPASVNSATSSFSDLGVINNAIVGLNIFKFFILKIWDEF